MQFYININSILLPKIQLYSLLVVHIMRTYVFADTHTHTARTHSPLLIQISICDIENILDLLHATLTLKIVSCEQFSYTHTHSLALVLNSKL